MAEADDSEGSTLVRGMRSTVGRGNVVGATFWGHSRLTSRGDTDGCDSVVIAKTARATTSCLRNDRTVASVVLPG